MLEQVEPPMPESPEKLLRELEIHHAGQRLRRERSARQRVLVLGGSLLLIVSAASVALLFLLSTLSELSPRSDSSAAPPQAEGQP